MFSVSRLQWLTLTQAKRKSHTTDSKRVWQLAAILDLFVRTSCIGGRPTAVAVKISTMLVTEWNVNIQLTNNIVARQR